MKHFIQTPELHSIHHQLGVHKYNFSDLPLWDKMFGTYKDTDEFAEHCGFPRNNERKLWKMMIFKVIRRDLRRLLKPHRTLDFLNFPSKANTNRLMV